MDFSALNKEDVEDFNLTYFTVVSPVISLSPMELYFYTFRIVIIITAKNTWPLIYRSNDTVIAIIK